jgi:hypothetical protein
MSALLVGFTCPGPAWSQEGIRVGDFRVHPNLELSTEWNDNIDLAPRDETADFLYVISPGISVELPGRQYALRLGYRADILQYREQDQLNETHHSVQADAKATFPGGLTLIASDQFKRTSDFAGFPVPELTQRVDRNENTLKVGAEYVIRERISVGLDYSFLWVDYRADPSFDDLDREDHVAGVTLYYRILPKTSILGEYDYQAIRYHLDDVAQDRDSDANKFKVGIKGDVTAKTTLLAKIGWESRDYKNPEREDFEGLTVEVEALYTYREPSQLRLFGGRGAIESLFEGGANFYVATYGGAEVRHQLGSRWLVKVTGLAGVNDYPEAVAPETKERSDHFYSFGLALRYQIQRWLAAELGYIYLVRDSNLADFDYANNRVKGSILVTF